MIGPGLFSQTFAVAIGPGTTWQLPGAPFVVASALLVGAMAIARRATRP